jgi:hypothetical protein
VILVKEMKFACSGRVDLGRIQMKNARYYLDIKNCLRRNAQAVLWFGSRYCRRSIYVSEAPLAQKRGKE